MARPREPESGTRRASTAEGIAVILGPAAEKGFGARSFATGAPGSGKTTLCQKLAQACLDYGVADLVLIHDAKDPAPQYEGSVFPSVSEFVAACEAREHPDNPTAIPEIAVFHPNETPDAVAEAGLTLARAGLPCAVFIDELYDALKGPQSFETGDKGPIPTIERKGRSLRASAFMGTQLPQTIPSVVFDLSETRVIFRTDTRSLSYLADRLKLPDAMTELIPKLAVGEFVISRLGFEWDGIVYGPS